MKSGSRKTKLNHVLCAIAGLLAFVGAETKAFAGSREQVAEKKLKIEARRFLKLKNEALAKFAAKVIKNIDQILSKLLPLLAKYPADGEVFALKLNELVKLHKKNNLSSAEREDAMKALRGDVQDLAKTYKNRPSRTSANQLDLIGVQNLISKLESQGISFEVLDLLDKFYSYYTPAGNALGKNVDLCEQLDTREFNVKAGALLAVGAHLSVGKRTNFLGKCTSQLEVGASFFDGFLGATVGVGRSHYEIPKGKYTRTVAFSEEFSGDATIVVGISKNSDEDGDVITEGFNLGFGNAIGEHRCALSIPICPISSDFTYVRERLGLTYNKLKLLAPEVLEKLI